MQKTCYYSCLILLFVATLPIFALSNSSKSIRFSCKKPPVQNITWGFFAHQRINRLAIFTLPYDMMPFYKAHIRYLMEHSVAPDQRRYAVKDEAPRHFIDLDAYGDSATYKLPIYWQYAVEKFTEDSLLKHGIVPWHIQLMKFQLTKAFQEKDAQRILRLSAEIGHYIADANVPLHTTSNYNGQKTNQIGIHGFWESRLPELYSDDYDFFVGTAEYERFIGKRSWQAVRNANLALDSVLVFEQQLNAHFKESKKYSIEERNGQNIKVYAKDYSKKYHQSLNNQVERQMKSAIKMIGDFWFSAWVDAGQPDLTPLLDFKLSEQQKQVEDKEQKSWIQKLFKVREEN
ncbi:zinc dependent phospholipase C [Arcicella aurantiaca]|uniref:Zinc dependent phospholipase C n=1 Tax=Arcicella aurantiaca TaxID=591202 RepID=A0A316F1A6_9BACT|nr:zinc dependent phospholipase C family protein [Arcicella aurantiaca]PWK29409.1 zinc dependent phospholipase C [Arcicella aurantiaca]